MKGSKKTWSNMCDKPRQKDLNRTHTERHKHTHIYTHIHRHEDTHKHIYTQTHAHTYTHRHKHTHKGYVQGLDTDSSQLY